MYSFSILNPAAPRCKKILANGLCLGLRGVVRNDSAGRLVFAVAAAALFGEGRREQVEAGKFMRHLFDTDDVLKGDGVDSPFRSVLELLVLLNREAERDKSAAK